MQINTRRPSYSINPHSNDLVRNNLANMEAVLKEVPTTYRILLELLQRHRRSVSMPGLDEYRTQLERKVAGAIRLSSQLAADTTEFAAILAELDKEVAKVQQASLDRSGVHAHARYK